MVVAFVACGGPQDVASRWSAFQVMSRPLSTSRHQRRCHPGQTQPYCGPGGRRDKARVTTQLSVATRLTPLLSSGRDSLLQEFVARWSWWRFVAPCVVSSG
ncbi:hypothetical protein Taro_053076 [Colocasia esculenta]|uniref:Uncharacterized protein n=1 Tax=Colocasia esculenta TaxID=4460 RepID=A0A843XLJ4_COLES|nr:hypothetical protein [Colocasia esculenta]